MIRRQLPVFVGILSLLAGAVDASPEADVLRERIAQFVRASVAIPLDSVEIPPVEELAVAAARPDVELRFSAAQRRASLGRVPVTVVLESEGRVLARRTILATAHAMRPVVVAARPVRSGEVIRPGHLALKEHDVALLSHAWVSDPSRLVGARARRFVPEGQPWRPDWVEPLPRIVRGERVKMRLQRGALLIEAAAVARDDGRDGDWIRLLSLASRREVLGRVEADGVVHVEF